MNDVRNEYSIGSPEEGALAVAACIIMTAVDDVRLFLKAPDLTSGRKTKVSRRSGITSTVRRRVLAAQAAQWLDSNDCLQLCSMLESCGHHVPLKRLKRQLADLKRKGAVRG